jgi:hypothetical protein
LSWSVENVVGIEYAPPVNGGDTVLYTTLTARVEANGTPTAPNTIPTLTILTLQGRTITV